MFLLSLLCRGDSVSQLFPFKANSLLALLINAVFICAPILEIPAQDEAEPDLME